MNTLRLLPLRAGGARPRVAASAERGWDAMNLGRRAGGSQSPCLRVLQRTSVPWRPALGCPCCSPSGPIFVTSFPRLRLLKTHLPVQSPRAQGFNPRVWGDAAQRRPQRPGISIPAWWGRPVWSGVLCPTWGVVGAGDPGGGGGARLETEASVPPGTWVCEVAVRGPREPRAGPLRLAAEPGSRPA